jgi:hypothetical protein
MSTYLNKLQREQKLELCLLRILDGATYNAIRDYIEETWQHKTSSQSVGNFFRSTEGEDLVSEAYKKLRSEYQEQPLIEKSTRMMAYRDQMVRLRHVMEGLPVGSEGWMLCSNEFRQYGKMISTEMEGLQVTVDDRTPSERAFQAALESMKIDPDSGRDLPQSDSS